MLKRTTTADGRPVAAAFEAAARTRVFIVDFHVLMRRGLSALIDAEPDMQFTGEAENAETAMREIARLRPDVAIIGVSRTRSSGVELIRNIKALDGGVRVIALSMCDEPRYVSQVLQAGALAYVMKQDVAERVLDAVRRARKGRSYVSENVVGQVSSVAPKAAVQRGARRPATRLDDTEQDIIGLIGCGLPARGIAARLHLSVRMVERYRSRIRTKLNFPSATQLVQFCVRWAEDNRATTVAP